MTGRKWEGVGGLGEVCAPSGLLPTPLALLLGALAPYSSSSGKTKLHLTGWVCNLHKIINGKCQ